MYPSMSPNQGITSISMYTYAKPVRFIVDKMGVFGERTQKVK